MKNNIKLIASDIEGTLVDGKGNLRKNVPNLIRTVNEEGIKFAVQSGMSLFEIEDILTKIRTETKLSDSFKMDIVAFGGAYIKSSDGIVLKDKPLTKEELEKVREIVKDCANGSVIIYRDKKENYREKLTEVESISGKVKYAGLVTLVGLLEAAKKVNLPNVKISQKMLEAKMQNNEIYSLEIINTGSELKKINEELSKAFGTSVDINQGRTVQFGHGNKLEGIKTIQKNNTGSDNLSGVCAIGDGINDIVALDKTEYAIVTNTKYSSVYNVAKESKSNKKFAIGEFDDETIKFLTNQEFSDEKMRETTNTSGKERIKHTEKENTL